MDYSIEKDILQEFVKKYKFDISKFNVEIRPIQSVSNDENKPDTYVIIIEGGGRYAAAPAFYDEESKKVDIPPVFMDAISRKEDGNYHYMSPASLKIFFEGGDLRELDNAYSTPRATSLYWNTVVNPYIDIVPGMMVGVPKTSEDEIDLYDLDGSKHSIPFKKMAEFLKDYDVTRIEIPEENIMIIGYGGINDLTPKIAEVDEDQTKNIEGLTRVAIMPSESSKKPIPGYYIDKMMTIHGDKLDQSMVWTGNVSYVGNLPYIQQYTPVTSTIPSDKPQIGAWFSFMDPVTNRIMQPFLIKDIVDGNLVASLSKNGPEFTFIFRPDAKYIRINKGDNTQIIVPNNYILIRTGVPASPQKTNAKEADENNSSVVLSVSKTNGKIGIFISLSVNGQTFSKSYSNQNPESAKAILKGLGMYSDEVANLIDDGDGSIVKQFSIANIKEASKLALMMFPKEKKIAEMSAMLAKSQFGKVLEGLAKVGENAKAFMEKYGQKGGTPLDSLMEFLSNLTMAKLPDLMYRIGDMDKITDAIAKAVIDAHYIDDEDSAKILEDALKVISQLQNVVENLNANAAI